MGNWVDSTPVLLNIYPSRSKFGTVDDKFNFDELIWKYPNKMQIEMFNKWKDTQVWGSGKRFKSNMDLENVNIHFAFKAMGVIRLI